LPDDTETSVVASAPSLAMTAWTTVFFPTSGTSAAAGVFHCAATFS
jgi:hypothetical protein